MLTVAADGCKLPPLKIFKGKPIEAGKMPTANSIEREFLNRKETEGLPYPTGMIYVVAPKV